MIDDIKGIISIDLEFKNEDGNRVISKPLTKKDLKKDIRLGIEFDIENINIGDSFTLSLYRINKKGRDIIKVENIIIQKISKSLFQKVSLNDLEKGLYEYELRDAEGNIITCQFNIGQSKKGLYIVIPALIISIGIFSLTRLDISFLSNMIEADTVTKENNGPLNASGNAGLTTEDIEGKERSETQKLLNDNTKETVVRPDILSTSTIISNSKGVISDISIKNNEILSYDLTTSIDFYKEEKAHSLSRESNETINEVFNYYDMKYIYDSVEDKESINLNAVFNNKEAKKFRVTLYNVEEQMLYDTDMIKIGGTSIQIILNEKLSEEPVLYRLQLYNNNDKELFNIYAPMELIENYKSENYCQYVILDSEGNELFVSPLTTPGAVLNSITLNKELPVGSYDVILRYSFYNKEKIFFYKYDKKLTLKVV
jgi:hypothetical protein